MIDFDFVFYRFEDYYNLPAATKLKDAHPELSYQVVNSFFWVEFRT